MKTDIANVLLLKGGLEIYEVDRLRQALTEHLSAQASPVIDLRDVTGCDTAGAQLLCAAARTAAGLNRPLRFINTPPQVAAAWTALGLDPAWLADPSRAV
ncbi:MAG: STAS domain-containing protein [Verrucomicrobiota bacterium]